MSLSAQQLIVEADRCVACGLCLPHCPTYRKTGSEADSPRGRIQLMSAVAKEILPANARFKQHIDLCLSCRSCESVCPNGVAYGALIDATRVTVANAPTVLNKLANHLVSHPQRMKLVTKFLRVAKNTGVLNITGKLIPSLHKAIALTPDITHQQTWQTLYATDAANKQGEVSLFLGCISDALDTDTLRAAVFTLNKLGYDVHIPKAQTCCGGIVRQQGNAEESAQLIVQNQKAFAPLNTMPLLTVASGCGAGLKDYLEDTAEIKVQDISDYLAACDWQNTELAPLPNEIYVQDPCTLRNVQKTAESVYKLLAKIPAATIKKLAGNSQCCGGAGAYMLTQQSMAKSLLDDKLNAIDAAQVSWLATSNIGCALHIAAGLRGQGKTIKVEHPVVIIAKQLGFTGKMNLGK